MNTVRLYFEISRNFMGEQVPFKCELMAFDGGKLVIDPKMLEEALENFSCDLLNKFQGGIHVKSIS